MTMDDGIDQIHWGNVENDNNIMPQHESEPLFTESAHANDPVDCQSSSSSLMKKESRNQERNRFHSICWTFAIPMFLMGIISILYLSNSGTSTSIPFIHSHFISPSSLETSSQSRQLQAATDTNNSNGSNNDSSSSSPSIPNHIHPKDYLDSKSVILITGAAGFLGSELAMALYHTFSPQKIILADSLQADVSTLTADNEDEDDNVLLQSMEYKRQRIFHVMQTLGNVGRFYKCDLRPYLPEFLEVGEIPVLDAIFKDHADITHVVHLATIDTNKDQAVPRNFEDNKAGWMESIMEQFKLLQDRGGNNGNHDDYLLPHLVYASSYEIYNSNQNGPLVENQTIESPMSFYGTSQLINEVLANTYYNMYGIYSVGLRFFEVYGPWGDRTSDITVLSQNFAENFSEEKDKNTLISEFLKDATNVDIGKDYVFIDDAVDAIIAAMQYRPPSVSIPNNDNDASTESASSSLNYNYPPQLFNIGSGQSYSLRQISEFMYQYLQSETPSQSVDTHTHLDLAGITPTLSLHASIEKAQSHLGFRSQIMFDEGIQKLLAWQHDRNVPYGPNPLSMEENNTSNKSAYAQSKRISSTHGISSCNPFDKECLNGIAAFPCVSECSHSDTSCLPSIYDSIVSQTKTLTDGCEAVLYTLALGNDLDRIPSATIHASPNSVSFIESNKENAHCNIAFVSRYGTLFRKLSLQQQQQQSQSQSQSGSTTTQPIIQHGFWTLVPISDANIEGLSTAERYLPKMVPQTFFSSTVQYAIYADLNVLFHNLPTLLNEMKESFHDGKTILMTPSTSTSNNRNVLHGMNGSSSISSQGNPNAQYYNVQQYNQASIQKKAYSMIQVGLNGKMKLASMSSPWMVHALENRNSEDDARLFRCDVLGEMMLWNVMDYDTGLNFISSMHDFWSRKMLVWEGITTLEQDEQDEELPSFRRRLDSETATTTTTAAAAAGVTTTTSWMGVISSSSSSQMKFVKVLSSDSSHVSYL